MTKERVEVLGGGKSATLDDFRSLELDGKLVGRRGKRDKGHAAAVAAAFAFFRDGGTPPIAYDCLIETTRATLIARDALASGDERPQPVARQSTL